jgi:hypothetical protein
LTARKAAVQLFSAIHCGDAKGAFFDSTYSICGRPMVVIEEMLKHCP